MYSCVFQGLYQLKTHKRGDGNFFLEILDDQNDQMTRSTVLKITGCVAVFMKMSSKDKLEVLLFTFFHTTPFNPCLNSRFHYSLELLRVMNRLIHPLNRVEVEMVHEFYSYGPSQVINPHRVGDHRMDPRAIEDGLRVGNILTRLSSFYLMPLILTKKKNPLSWSTPNVGPQRMLGLGTCWKVIEMLVTLTFPTVIYFFLRIRTLKDFFWTVSISLLQRSLTLILVNILLSNFFKKSINRPNTHFQLGKWLLYLHKRGKHQTYVTKTIICIYICHVSREPARNLVWLL